MLILGFICPHLCRRGRPGGRVGRGVGVKVIYVEVELVASVRGLDEERHVDSVALVQGESVVDVGVDVDDVDSPVSLVHLGRVLEQVRAPLAHHFHVGSDVQHQADGPTQLGRGRRAGGRHIVGLVDLAAVSASQPTGLKEKASCNDVSFSIA